MAGAWRGRRAARVGAAVALAGVLVGSGGGAALGARAVGPAAAPGAGRWLSAGQAGPRAAVPWSRVGPGWELAMYWRGQSSWSGKGIKAPITLYLVDPSGGRYEIHRWAATKNPLYLLDWSHDKSKVLLVPGLETNPLTQLNLVTGRLTHVRLPQQLDLIGYTWPTTSGLLGAREVKGSVQLARYSLTGRRLQILATGPQANVVAYSDNGTTLAVPAAKGVELVNASTGHLVRSLPVPGSATNGCQPARWWTPATLLVTCHSASADPARLWLVPASGARPAPLTPQRAGGSVDQGDVEAWRQPGGLTLQGLTGDGLGIFRQPAHGAVQAVRVPGSADLNWALSVHGSRVLVLSEHACQGTASLLWLDPATDRVSTLLKAPKGEAGVLDALPYGLPFAAPSYAVGCGSSTVRVAHR
jgi:hypothetical protein